MTKYSALFNEYLHENQRKYKQTLNKKDLINKVLVKVHALLISADDNYSKNHNHMIKS